MKRVITAAIGSILLLAGCTPAYESGTDVVQETEDAGKQTTFVPSYSISDDLYRTPMEKQYNTSESRGVILNQVNNRLDIDELEVGLRRLSKDDYPPEDFLFREGQYLTKSVLFDWLERSSKTEEGLNPAIKDDSVKKQHEDHPRYLAHIVEQNYLKKNDEGNYELGGVSLGLALRSIYTFRTEQGGPQFEEPISEEEMLKEGKKLAQTVLERLREMDSLENVPVSISLYRLEGSGSMVPGNFVSKTEVDSGSNQIEEWTSIKEDYILFPSSEAEKEHFDDAQLINSFEDEINNYFPNYVGVIGKGFYKDDELQEMKIDIPIEFQGKAEVIGFTQYVYGLIKETFPNYFHIEVNIESSYGQESLIVREPGESDPYVHIYDQ
ncbi:hypothetical protein N781_08245 [Pontibacillus halophilus JSM 076056 = DSM 19796]|uniref:CamS family sex pheromone protein n=1 Tax=Pontibacillus halophilus JSM 076056 = DSM 19796 TaxID=1385510 RepID=A0A0A5GAM4_9BACI|nr:CamS family sex pheromone protein [Pontibacillus halophilus]KGX90226.1 hypothetical protein N781_08245 [Pontibacillus halophilus JSM 076056 = DSM 19796]